MQRSISKRARCAVSAPLPAISCLGAFRPPAARAVERFVIAGSRKPAQKRTGRVIRGITRAFIAAGNRDLTTSELLVWTHIRAVCEGRNSPRERHYYCKDVRRTADRIAERVGRSSKGEGRPMCGVSRHLPNSPLRRPPPSTAIDIAWLSGAPLSLPTNLASLQGPISQRHDHMMRCNCPHSGQQFCPTFAPRCPAVTQRSPLVSWTGQGRPQREGHPYLSAGNKGCLWL